MQLQMEDFAIVPQNLMSALQLFFRCGIQGIDGIKQNNREALGPGTRK